MENQPNMQDGEEQPPPPFNKSITSSPSASEGSETEYESGTDHDYNANDNGEHEDIKVCQCKFISDSICTGLGDAVLIRSINRSIMFK